MAGAGEAVELVVFGPPKPTISTGLKGIVSGLAGGFNVHPAITLDAAGAIPADVIARVRGIGVSGLTKLDAGVLARFPKLEIVSTFGVGYDHIDVKFARENGIIVTNTPDVLNEETADTAIGLLLCTVRNLINADRYVRDGKWLNGAFPLSNSLRDRTVGMVGMGRIGRAIARRLDAMRVPVVYHSRRPAEGVSYRHYPDLPTMARDVDVLLVIVPGGKDTANMIDAQVLEALGPNGIFINLARGSVCDEPALIAALKGKKILAAGLDVFAKEPQVPAELIAMDNVVLFPHVGSASVFTRTAMEQLVVDNLKAWFSGKPPLTPVVETPVASSRARKG